MICVKRRAFGPHNCPSFGATGRQGNLSAKKFAAAHEWECNAAARRASLGSGDRNPSDPSPFRTSIGSSFGALGDWTEAIRWFAIRLQRGVAALSGQNGDGNGEAHQSNPTADRRAANIIDMLKAEPWRVRYLRADQDLFVPGSQLESLYILTEGWAFQYLLLENGKRQILHFSVADALLGVPLFAPSVTTFGVQALSDIAVFDIPYRKLIEFIEKRPTMGLALAQLISRDLDLAFDRIACVGRFSARVRVARLLLQLFMMGWSRLPGNGTLSVRLPLTQEQLGDATGLSSVHVNRVLAELRREGILAFHYRRLEILDPDKLIDTAEVDPELLKSWIK